MVEMTTCFECDDSVPVAAWGDHVCQPDEIDGYDPAEPWRERDLWDDE